MRRWLAALALLLAGCAPALLTPELDRANASVTVTASAPAYSVTLIVLNAVTNDARCAPIQQDLGCVLGDVAVAEPAVVRVEARGELDCVAFGFSNPELNIGSYRPYPCTTGGGK